ncbi:sulfate ABC transporter permease [Streptomyces violarus]|uniref:NitT/TauT family transport system permease protein n=1 Tax=Streptomyces violarus TaxID=67380 RepID=A0A7W5EZJ2_9ACTN|nr:MULTISPECIES: ABC transporter permease [Streptomyces]MBB3074506.1 NitT/TauT family transport system permease protein [Streptomyces violarus]WRT97193.1 ABC transporter permease [Streptomyces sp. CGMCC 4.1772]GHC99524.1 sulfate ABC transporter permease [Streptomyces violarus]
MPGADTRRSRKAADARTVLPDAPRGGVDLDGLSTGLDALQSTQHKGGARLGGLLLARVLPPVVAIVLILAVWELVHLSGVKPDYVLPGPGAVWDALVEQWYLGTTLGVIGQSVSRGALGFLAAVAIGTPLGLFVWRVRPVRTAIGPMLTGLQSLPSVAWVPAAVIWFGLTDTAIYAVVLLGAVPSVANGLVAGMDQVPPLFVRAGRSLGARGLRGVRHILLPAALPGYLAGLKQGWAFSWRSLMAAELIAGSPEMGYGLGQMLENGRVAQDMPLVLATILLILCVGISVDLLVFAPLERYVLRTRGLLERAP